MAVPLGTYDSEGVVRHRLLFERGRGSALDVAGQLVGQAGQQQYQSLDRARRQLDTQFRRQGEREPTVTPRDIADRRNRVEADVRAELRPLKSADMFEIEQLRDRIKRSPSEYSMSLRQAVEKEYTFRTTFHPEIEAPPSRGLLDPVLRPVGKGLEEYQKRVGDPFAAAATQTAQFTGPIGAAISALPGGPEPGTLPPREELVNPFTALYSKKEQEKAQQVLGELDPVSRLIVSFIADPANLLPVVGFGPELKGVVSAIRRGGPEGLAAIRRLAANPALRTQLERFASERGGSRLSRVFHGTTSEFEGLPTEGRGLLGKGVFVTKDPKYAERFAGFHPANFILRDIDKYGETGSRIYPLRIDKKAKILSLSYKAGKADKAVISAIEETLSPEELSLFRRHIGDRSGTRVHRALSVAKAGTEGVKEFDPAVLDEVIDTLRAVGVDVLELGVNEYQVINPEVLRSVFEPKKPSFGERLLTEEAGGSRFGQPPAGPPPIPPRGLPPSGESGFLPEPVQGVEEIRGPTALRPEEQDAVGEALTRLSGVPDEIVVVPTQRNLPTLQAFESQATDAKLNYNSARSRLAGLRNLAQDQLASPDAIARASDLTNQAKRQMSNSKSALQSARLRFAKQDVIDAALSASGDNTAAQFVGRAFDDLAQTLPIEEPLLTAGAWRQQVARVVGAIRGTPVGAVGRIADQAQIMTEALHRVTVEQHFPVFKRVQQGINKYHSQIQYIGPKEWSEIALGPYRDYHIIQHPEWWSGIPKSLAADMQEAQRLMRRRFDFMLSLGHPGEALETAYLEQLWDLPRSALEARVPRARGRVSITRPRLFGDYAEGLKRGFVPRSDMTVQDLMEHSNALLDQAISDAFIRQEVLRRFGKKVKNLKTGIRPFNHPLYRGWNAQGEVVAWIDQLYNPPGQILRSAQDLSGAFKNTAFGAVDIAVGGVQFPLSISQAGLSLAVGGLNRSLEFMHLPHFIQYAHDPAVASRMAQNASRGGVHLGIGPASVRLKGGTIVKYIPVIGKTLDKPLVAITDNLAKIQFGVILGVLRNRIYEGNLMLLRMTGENIDDPRIRHLAGDWANSSTGASRGALTPGRRAVESAALTSFQMTRSQLATLGAVAKGFGPKASRAERLRTAITLANFAAYVYGIQYLVNKQFGDGPMEWIPGKRDWATIKIKGQTVPIVPNRSLLGAMERSVEYLVSSQPEDIPRAWAQLATGRISPLVQAPLSLAGFGFEPGTGKFRPGTLSQRGRLIGVAPIPPLIETATFETTDPTALGLAAVGFNPFIPSALSEMQDIPQYKGIDNDTVREIMGNDGFLDRVAEFRRELIRTGTPLEQVRDLPTLDIIKLLAEREGKSDKFAAWAVILSHPTERRKRTDPEWLRFVVKNEDRLRKEAPWLFNQELEEFLRRVHLKEAK